MAEGHIRRRGKNSHTIVVDLPKHPDGSRNQKWITVHGTKKDAQRERARIIHEINTGAYVAPTQLTLREFVERWLHACIEPKNPKTLENYCHHMDHVCRELGTVRLDRLTPLHVQDYATKALASGRRDGKAGLSPATVNKQVRLLRQALGQAVKWGLVGRNVAALADAPPLEPEERPVYDEAGLAALLSAAAGTRLWMPVLLAVATGLRRGEILGLKWESVDFAAKSLRVREQVGVAFGRSVTGRPKTKKSRRSVGLPDVAIEALIRHRGELAQRRLLLGERWQGSDLVCPREDGSPWPPTTFSQAFRRLLERGNLPPIRFHDLRHTYSTHLLSSGVLLRIVSESLGHARVSTTSDIYGHLLPGQQHVAAEAADQVLRRAMKSSGAR